MNKFHDTIQSLLISKEQYSADACKNQLDYHSKDGIRRASTEYITITGISGTVCYMLS